MATFTIDDLRKMVELLEKNEAKPFRVKNESEAKSMTENDPIGHIWNVGDEFCTVNGDQNGLHTTGRLLQVK